MKDKLKKGFRITQIFLIALTVILFSVLFVHTLLSDKNKVQEIRPAQNLFQINDYSFEEKMQSGTPIGVVGEYTFSIPHDITQDTSLSFYLLHEYVQVYVDDMCIFRMECPECRKIIKTPGCNWATVPILREYAGKEIRVVIMPVYQSVRSHTVKFLVGPKETLVINQLKKDLLTFIICVLLVFCGIVLIVFSVYLLITQKTGWRITSYGFMLICVGLWRFLDSRSVLFLFHSKTVFLFYFSNLSWIVFMMPVMLAQRNQFNRISINIYTFSFALLCAIVAILQLFGIADLREFFPAFHAFVAFGVVILLATFAFHYKKRRVKFSSDIALIFLLFLALILDLTVYYVQRSSDNLIFLLIAFLFASLHVITNYAVDYSKQERVIAEQKNQIILSKVTSMMGQIRSHFVFNVLNAISGLCKYDPEKADRAIVYFSRYLRTNIDLVENDQPLPFQTDLHHLENYVELLKISFGNKIRFETNIETDQFYIPLLILQPLVENSFKHGIFPKPEGGTVILRTWRDGETFKISVEDDGIGFDTNSVGSKSVGIKNARFRLEKMIQGRLDIESSPGIGTKATITLPASAAILQIKNGRDTL